MNKLILALTLIWLQNSASFAEQSPLEIAQLDLKVAKESCLNEGHEFRFAANPVATADLGGSDELEAIFDYGALDCAGDSWMYSGELGATVDIYAHDDQVSYISSTGYELVPFKGRWAARFQMSEVFSVDECMQNCWRYVYLNNNAFVEIYVEDPM